MTPQNVPLIHARPVSPGNSSWPRFKARQLLCFKARLTAKGKKAREKGQDKDDATQAELVAYSRQVLRFVSEVLNMLTAAFETEPFSRLEGGGHRELPGR